LTLKYRYYLFHLPPLMNPMFLMRLYHLPHQLYRSNLKNQKFRYYLMFQKNLTPQKLH
jgi:hypothetical protein